MADICSAAFQTMPPRMEKKFMAVKDNELPLRAKCDLSDPEERFLWTFVGLPNVIGAQLVFPLAWWRKVSAHLVKCGVMLSCPNCGHEESPEIRYRLRPGDDPMMGGGGEWVDASIPEGEDDLLADKLQQLTPQIRKAMLDKLREEFPDDPGLDDA